MWSAGVVALWYLRTSQLDIYRLLINERNPFIQTARRFGKTTSILAFVLEQLRLNPNWIARWCFPFKNQAREVLLAEMTKIQAQCPAHLKFNYSVTDSVFVGPNGSKLYIRGVNEDRGESARGAAANIIVADEYGFWNEPKYIIQSVLYPQLENQEGRWLIKASTPPPNLGHIYYAEREVAKRLGRFVNKTIYDNEALSKEELSEIIQESGGVDSVSFRRERLCEDVGDPELLVIPEFNDQLNVVPDDYPRPDFYTPYVAGDSGADDNTAVLFGYYDFIKNEVVVEKELILNGKTTAEIIAVSKSIEKNLWGETKPSKRVYDAPKQLIYDIYVDYQWPVQMPQKDDKIAAIHDLRTEVQQRKFKLKTSCVNTINQLKVGLWKDQKKLDFERTEGLGHLDAIAACIYLNRSIDRSVNPRPLHHGLNHEQYYIPQTTNTSSNPTSQALKTAFGGLTGRLK